MIKMLKFSGSLLLADLFDGHTLGFQFLREWFFGMKLVMIFQNFH